MLKLSAEQSASYNGVVGLFRLSEPLEGHDVVIMSSVVAPYSGPETMIFGASEDGEVVSWSELPGSSRGNVSHETALRRAGYEVVS